jgi:hypothetical protein
MFTGAEWSAVETGGLTPPARPAAPVFMACFFSQNFLIDGEFIVVSREKNAILLFATT